MEYVTAALQTIYIEKWHPADVVFFDPENHINPYLDVHVSALFHGPDHIVLEVPGFYAGVNIWKIRFAPTAIGEWHYITSSTEPSLDKRTGVVHCIENSHEAVHGRLQINRNYHHHYSFEDGTPYFQMGYEIDWLGLLDFGDPDIVKAKNLIDMVANYHFSEILMNAYAHDTTWLNGNTSAYDFGPPGEYAWAGTNSSPDHSRMNEVYWQSYDRVIDYLFQKGIIAHIYLKVYNKLVNWPEKYSVNEEMYFKYIIARYQAYPNIIWDFSKESYYEEDKEYIHSRLNIVKANDAYQRLRTLHDNDGGDNQYPTNYYDMQGMNDNIDCYTDQANIKTPQGGLYGTALYSQKNRNLPYYNAETTFYQIGNDGGHSYNVCNSKENTFKSIIEPIMCGGYSAYYYTYHAWDLVKYDETPDSLIWYKHLSDFFRGTNYQMLIPNDGLIESPRYDDSLADRHCLAIPGSEYIVYMAECGNVTLTITEAGKGTPLKAKWINLYTGEESSAGNYGNGTYVFTNCWANPSMLYLHISV